VAADEHKRWFANRGQIIQIALTAVACSFAGVKAWPDMEKDALFSGGSVLFYILVVVVLVSVGRTVRSGLVAPAASSLRAGPALSVGTADEAYQRFLRLGVTNFYANRRQVPNDHWVTWLSEAKRYCVLLGQAHGEWCLDPGFRPTLIARLRNGVSVEIFFLKPGGLAAQLRRREDSTGIRDTDQRIRSSMREVWAIRGTLEPAVKDRLKLYVYDATPSVGVTWIDDKMLVTHYLASFTNLTSPALVVDPTPTPDTLGTPYWVYGQNVDGIRARFSEEITDDNIDILTREETDGHAA
jgi:hypothetical protein